MDSFDLYRTFDATSTMRLDFHPVRNGFHFALPALTIPELDDALPNSAKVDSRMSMSDYYDRIGSADVYGDSRHPRDCND